MSANHCPIKRALISVADKTGIVAFAQALQQLGIAILATGNTALVLREHGVVLTEVAEYTEFPEMMGGRIKTLHPKIHGGLLARRECDKEVAAAHGIQLIDLAVINLYPFAETIRQADCTLQQAIEQIDIGGPAMLRSAAKNHAAVTVVIDPQDYALILDELHTQAGCTQLATRRRLATKVFTHTSQYDKLIAHYLQHGSHATDQQTVSSSMPDTVQINLHKTQDLRYGENPQQAAAFYAPNTDTTDDLPWKLWQGKPLSFNNLVDADVAWNCVSSFKQAACVIVKHANPCGVAVADCPIDAYQKAYATDASSAFGGIIACNQPIDATLCATILRHQFVEVIIGPAFTDEALHVLAAKPDVRAMCPPGPARINISLRYQAPRQRATVTDTRRGGNYPC